MHWSTSTQMPLHTLGLPPLVTTTTHTPTTRCPSALTTSCIGLRPTWPWRPWTSQCPCSTPSIRRAKLCPSLITRPYRQTFWLNDESSLFCALEKGLSIEVTNSLGIMYHVTPHLDPLKIEGRQTHCCWTPGSNGVWAFKWNELCKNGLVIIDNSSSQLIANCCFGNKNQCFFEIHHVLVLYL